MIPGSFSSLHPDKLAAVTKAIGRPDLLADARFSDPAKLMANMPQLAAILDGIFCAEPMEHWYKVFNGVHVTSERCVDSQEVINDPQLLANDIIVRLNGAGGKLTVHNQQPASGAWRQQGVCEASSKARRTHEEVSSGSSVLARPKLMGLHESGAIPKAKETCGLAR